jgi:membrane protease YdiL (CAAX protease family)
MPDDPPTEPRRQGFARIASGLLWAFALGFVLAAVQVGRALWSQKVWMNFRGDVVSQAAMRGELIFFALGAIFCALLAWYWHRTWRRQS